MTMRQIALAVCVCLVAILLGVPVAVAQTTNASIVGIVTDASGAAVPNATVTVTNAGTGVSRTVTTNEAGAYTVTPLIPGVYEVKASNPGFKTKVQSNIVLETGDRNIIRHSDHVLGIHPFHAKPALLVVVHMGVAVEFNLLGVLGTRELPRIPALEPFIR